jgi:hypothetical protein
MRRIKSHDFRKQPFCTPFKIVIYRKLTFRSSSETSIVAVGPSHNFKSQNTRFLVLIKLTGSHNFHNVYGQRQLLAHSRYKIVLFVI